MTNSVLGQGDTVVSAYLTEILNEYPVVRDFTISNDGKEAYFTVQSLLEEVSQIVQIRYRNGHWSKGDLCSFSCPHKDLEPFLSPDNLRLYFVSNRPLVDSIQEAKDYDIWYVKREDLESSWSEPINMGFPINTTYNEFYPSISNNMNLYFTSDASGYEGKDNILMCEWIGDKYSQAISLGSSINSDGYEYNAYISRDESYIIFGSYKRKDGYGSGDLYLSKKNKEGKWSKVKNLGAGINSKSMDYCPFVDEGTKTLYFTSKRSNLIGRSFKNIEEMKQTINGIENGKSTVYRIKLITE